MMMPASLPFLEMTSSMVVDILEERRVIHIPIACLTSRIKGDKNFKISECNNGMAAKHDLGTRAFLFLII